MKLDQILIEEAARNFVQAAERLIELTGTFSLQFYPSGRKSEAQFNSKNFYKLPGTPIIEDFGEGRLKSKAQLYKIVGGMKFFCLLDAREVQDYLPWEESDF